MASGVLPVSSDVVRFMLVVAARSDGLDRTPSACICPARSAQRLYGISATNSSRRSPELGMRYPTLRPMRLRPDRQRQRHLPGVRHADPGLAETDPETMVGRMVDAVAHRLSRQLAQNISR